MKAAPARARAALLALLLCCSPGWPGLAAAHPLDPSLLELRETVPGQLVIRLRTPRSAAFLEPVLPAACAPRSDPDFSAGERHALRTWEVACPGAALVGRQVGLDGLAVRQTDALLRLELADGTVVQSVLRAERPTFEIPERMTTAAVAFEYVRLGVTHILEGADHLAFVLGLMLLVPDRRRLVWTITAFTVGHSITLVLATFDLVRIPSAAAEVLIAASIAVVARELLRTGENTAPRLTSTRIALGFGALHGLGFAGALAEIGLPAGTVPLALFAFNLGVELGQLAFVAAILAAAALLRRLPLPAPGPARFVPAYALGALAAYWVIERAALLF